MERSRASDNRMDTALDSTTYIGTQTCPRRLALISFLQASRLTVFFSFHCLFYSLPWAMLHSTNNIVTLLHLLTPQISPCRPVLFALHRSPLSDPLFLVVVSVFSSHRAMPRVCPSLGIALSGDKLDTSIKMSTRPNRRRY